MNSAMLLVTTRLFHPRFSTVLHSQDILVIMAATFHCYERRLNYCSVFTYFGPKILTAHHQGRATSVV